MPAPGDIVIAEPTPCTAPAYAGLIGQPEGALAGVVIPDPARIIRPGDPVTRDYREGRLNFMIDEAGRIADVTCG